MTARVNSWPSYLELGVQPFVDSLTSRDFAGDAIHLPPWCAPATLRWIHDAWLPCRRHRAPYAGGAAEVQVPLHPPDKLGVGMAGRCGEMHAWLAGAVSERHRERVSCRGWWPRMNVP